MQGERQEQVYRFPKNHCVIAETITKSKINHKKICAQPRTPVVQATAQARGDTYFKYLSQA